MILPFSPAWNFAKAIIKERLVPFCSMCGTKLNQGKHYIQRIEGEYVVFSCRFKASLAPHLWVGAWGSCI